MSLMSRLRIFLPKLFVALTLSLGRMPRVVTLLELLQTPSVARVILTRRRRLDYTEFFTLLDRDGRQAAPIVRSLVATNRLVQTCDTRPYENYIPVDAA
jgi:hypothetical protein